jgi:hypothetical protein
MYLHLPRHNEDFTGGQRSRTAWANFSPVHASRHVDVGEQQGNIRARFEQGNRFVRVASLKGHETRFLDDFDSKHPQQRITLTITITGGDLLGDPTITSMKGNVLKRNITDRALFRLIDQSAGHPKAMRLQLRIKSFGRQLSEIRCQTQELKLALSVVFGIGHAHLQKK